eukprot:11091-Heterococcus_DN1.PRE.1
MDSTRLGETPSCRCFNPALSNEYDDVLPQQRLAFVKKEFIIWSRPTRCFSKSQANNATHHCIDQPR